MPFSADDAKIAAKNTHTFWGVFKPNGAGLIDNNANVSGYGVGPQCGFTVTRAPTGLYTVTLRESYPANVAINPTAYNLGARWVDAVTPPGPLINGFGFQLQAKDNAGAAADVAAGTNVLIGFVILLKAKGPVPG